MRSTLRAGGIALLLAIGALLIIIPVASVFASSTGGTTAMSSVLTVPAVTPTPDTTSAVNAANNAVSHAQDLLNIMGWFATILGVVLGLFSLFAIVIGFLGFSSYTEFRKLVNDLRDNLTKIQADADSTRAALVYLSLGDRLLNQKNTDEALKNYKEAGKLLPRDIQVQSMLGRIYSGAGDYDTAITTFQAALPMLENEQPRDNTRLSNVEKELGLAYRRRGQYLNQESDYDAAIQHLKKATGLNATDSDAYAILGGLYRRKKEYRLAYDSYRQARRLNPSSSYALGNLASLAWYEGKLDEARRDFGFAEDEATNRIKKGQGEIYWDYYDLALAQLALGKIAEADKNYAIAIKETPGKEQFKSVLDNLYLLQEAPQPMRGLGDVVKLIEDAANAV